MKTSALHCLRLALLLAASVALAACAGTRNNAQQADTAKANHVDMNTPF